MRPGGDAVITRLADILIVQVIRSWLARDSGAQTGWVGALRDKQIGRAIALIHRDPARVWTLSSLATEIGMSRSAFAARFTQLVGEPAMHYAARWKMQAAALVARRGRPSAGRAGEPARLRIRSRVQPGLQAVHRGVAGRGPAARPAAPGAPEARRDEAPRHMRAEWPDSH